MKIKFYNERRSIKFFVFLIVMCIFMDSCKSGSKITDQQNLENINSDSKITLLNTSYKAEKNKKTVQYKCEFLHLLNLYDIKTDTIHLRFNKKDELVINYIEDIKGLKRTQQYIFQGRFKRDKSYEIILSEERIRIPPIIPIVFGKTNIDKIKLNITPQGDVVITNYYRRDGNIFILAAGSSATTNYFYEVLIAKSI